MYSVFPATVIVGRVTHIALYIPLYANDLGVLSSFTLIINMFPFAGVPVGAQKVAHSANAVTYSSFLWLSPVGVGAESDVTFV